MFYFFLLVLYFSLVAPAISYLFSSHVVRCMCAWQINDDDDDISHAIGGFIFA